MEVLFFLVVFVLLVVFFHFYGKKKVVNEEDFRCKLTPSLKNKLVFTDGPFELEEKYPEADGKQVKQFKFIFPDIQGEIRLWVFNDFIWIGNGNIWLQEYAKKDVLDQQGVLTIGYSNKCITFPRFYINLEIASLVLLKDTLDENITIYYEAESVSTPPYVEGVEIVK